MKMGTGIAGGFVLDFYFRHEWDRDYFLKEKKNVEFLEFYKEEVTDEGMYYTLNYPGFIREFKDYFYTFHSLLETKLNDNDTFDAEFDAVVQKNDMKGFIQYLSHADTCYAKCWSRGFFSVLTICPLNSIIFYHGSYKAILEEYKTLDHIENLLIKACDHPLAKITKFGIFG
jgi:hypothetical protein